MEVQRFETAERYEPEKDWKRVSLCNRKDISVEHFVKPPRHVSPRHEHPSAQVLVVLEGRLTVETDDDERELQKGDAVFIPGHETHVVKNPSRRPSVGIDIFVPGRSFDFWLNRARNQNPEAP